MMSEKTTDVLRVVNKWGKIPYILNVTNDDGENYGGLNVANHDEEIMMNTIDVLNVADDDEGENPACFERSR